MFPKVSDFGFDEVLELGFTKRKIKKIKWVRETVLGTQVTDIRKPRSAVLLGYSEGVASMAVERIFQKTGDHSE